MPRRRAGCGWYADGTRADVEHIDPSRSKRTASSHRSRPDQGLAVSGAVRVDAPDGDSVLEIDSATGRVVSRIGRITSDGSPAETRGRCWPTGRQSGHSPRPRRRCSPGSRVVGSRGGSPSAPRQRVAAPARASGWAAQRPHQQRGGACVSTPTTARSSSGSFRLPRAHRPSSPIGKDLWVITSGGEAKLVSPGR